MAITSADEDGILIIDRCFGVRHRRLPLNQSAILTQLSFNPKDQEEVVTATHKRRMIQDVRQQEYFTMPFETTSYRIQRWTAKKMINNEIF